MTSHTFHAFFFSSCELLSAFLQIGLNRPFWRGGRREIREIREEGCLPFIPSDRRCVYKENDSIDVFVDGTINIALTSFANVST